MRITDRDVAIFKFINEFGFCEIRQIEKKFNVTRSRGYKIMERLVKAGLVNHKRVFHGAFGVFYLTKAGTKYTDLPPIKNIPKNNYEHQLAIFDAYFQIMEQHPYAYWVGERRIKREKFMDGIGKRGHLADAMLLMPDEKKIAIEVELTRKSKEQLRDIFKGYGGQ